MKVARSGITAGLIFAALAAAPVLSAQGKAVTSHNGACRVTVPADWSVSGNFGIANSADNTADVAVTSPANTKTLADLKQTAQMIYTGDKVVKDTASEFQMEGTSMNGKPNVYRAIQLPGKLCIVEVTYSSGTVEDARKIAESVKAAQ
jgi:hypothetical protein